MTNLRKFSIDKYITIQGKPVLPYNVIRECWVMPGGGVLRHEDDARSYADKLLAERKRLEGAWFKKHGQPRW